MPSDSRSTSGQISTSSSRARPPRAEAVSIDAFTAANADTRSDGALIDLKSLSEEEMERFVLEELGEPPARARSLWRALYRDLVPDAAAAPYGPALRAKLAARASAAPLELLEVVEAADGARKAVYGLRGGGGRHRVESVLIPDGARTTVCVSSQVGCAMGCAFCLTATMGLARSLTPGEIVEQVVMARRLLRPGDPPVTNVVFMGMGEPLDNLEAVLAAVRTLASPAGLALAPRRLSVSTAGLAPAVRRFTRPAAPAPPGPPPPTRRRRECGARLAVSLNASGPEQRAALMPVARRPGCSLPELLAAMREYAAARGEPVFVEYVLIGGVNDSDADAAAAAELLAGLPAKVNLIAWNAHGGGPAADFRPPAPDRVPAWRAALAARGIVATVRAARGEDRSAACGTLALARGPQ